VGLAVSLDNVEKRRTSFTLTVIEFKFFSLAALDPSLYLLSYPGSNSNVIALQTSEVPASTIATYFTVAYCSEKEIIEVYLILLRLGFL
jgi:hypothetical protein